jgi:ribosome maturation factor RimP
VTLDDCAAISRQLVTSWTSLDRAPHTGWRFHRPGLDRPVGKFVILSAAGKRIKIRIGTVPWNGRKNFTGVLSDISSLTVQLTVGKKAVDIQFADIVKANLVE